MVKRNGRARSFAGRGQGKNMDGTGKKLARRRILKALASIGALAAGGLHWRAGLAASSPLTLLDDLKAALRTRLILPPDPGYDEARRVWNGMIDRRPAAIARCGSVEDVIRVIDFARESEIPVSVRGGGHNVAGKAVRDGAILIDLGAMQDVRVDAGRRRGFAGGGARWSTFDAATTAKGLVTTGGTIASTGVGGLTLGGGLGWLMRRHGLSCDNLVGAEVVTADGQRLAANADENPDLYWALRGGGGNFGVVTSFEFALHDEEPLLAGVAVYPGRRIPDMLRFFREYTANAPEALTTIAGISGWDDTATGPDRNMGWIGVCHSGAPERGEEHVRPVREFGPPLEDGIGRMSYRELQAMFGSSAPGAQRVYWRSNFMTGLPDEAIELITERANAGMPTEDTVILLEHMGGAIRRLGQHDTAFSNRHAEYNVSVLAEWQEAGDDERNIAWTRRYGDELKAFATGAGYVNYMTGDEGAERVHSTYATNLERLIQVKRKYDPANFFSSNQNIAP
jgi:FAD/FMN-containing dehydrogenase